MKLSNPGDFKRIVLLISKLEDKENPLVAEGEENRVYAVETLAHIASCGETIEDAIYYLYGSEPKQLTEEERDIWLKQLSGFFEDDRPRPPEDYIGGIQEMEFLPYHLDMLIQSRHEIQPTVYIFNPFTCEIQTDSIHNYTDKLQKLEKLERFDALKEELRCLRLTLSTLIVECCVKSQKANNSKTTSAHWGSKAEAYRHVLTLINPQ